MKLFSIIILFTLSCTTAYAQQETGTVTLRGTRLTYPLVQRWIDAFRQEYPGIRVAITPTIAGRQPGLYHCRLCGPLVCHGFRVLARSSSTPESSIVHIGFRCAKDL